MVPFKIVLSCVLVLAAKVYADDKGCAARPTDGESVVCVCNAEYCDEINRETPAQDKFVAYTSSEAGSRFQKVIGNVSDNANTADTSISLTLNPNVTYQVVEGFGGAVTDAAGINWKNLSDANLEQKLIDSYFSNTGIEYNMLRVPIGGCDFSTYAYAYNDLPVDDVKLANYSLTSEDYELKIPMIKAIQSAATTDVHIVATTWSPPPWMKSNGKYTGFSRLKDEYYQTYADYHLKFLEKYAAEDIPVWGITTTNEPTNGALNLAPFNTLGWTPGDMGKWIVNNLGPTIRNSTFKDVKIITSDDQRLTIPIWFNLLVKLHPQVLDYIDGVGVHYYTDQFTPASVLAAVSKTHPEKFLLGTEACEGSQPWQKEKVLLGSWDRAKRYIIDIIEDMTYNAVGWIDWNLCLNAQGGPNWVENFVDSPIIVFPEKKEFIKQPMFYAMGHFSKFIPRGSRRIEAVVKKSIFTSGVENLAFLTPQNTIVVVLYNDGSAKQISLKLGSKSAVVSLEAKSIVTVEMPYETS